MSSYLILLAAVMTLPAAHLWLRHSQRKEQAELDENKLAAERWKPREEIE